MGVVKQFQYSSGVIGNTQAVQRCVDESLRFPGTFDMARQDAISLAIVNANQSRPPGECKPCGDCRPCWVTRPFSGPRGMSSLESTGAVSDDFVMPHDEEPGQIRYQPWLNPGKPKQLTSYIVGSTFYGGIGRRGVDDMLVAMRQSPSWF